MCLGMAFSCTLMCMCLGMTFSNMYILTYSIPEEWHRNWRHFGSECVPCMWVHQGHGVRHGQGNWWMACWQFGGQGETHQTDSMPAWIRKRESGLYVPKQVCECMYACMWCVYVMYVCMYACIWCMCVMYVRMYVHVCVYACMYVCMYVHDVCVYVCVCVCI